MPKQLAKRTTSEWLGHVLEQFNDHSLSEVETCLLLGKKGFNSMSYARRGLRLKSLKILFI